MSFESQTFSKVDARRVFDRIPEIRMGAVDVPKSVVGFCNKAGENYGKVFAFLQTASGPILYSGNPNKIRRSVFNEMNSDEFVGKCQKMVQVRGSEGYQDLDSKTVAFRSWNALSTEDPIYRGKKRTKCSKKKAKTCKKSKTCTWRKSYKRKSGKRVSGTCYKKPKSKTSRKHKSACNKKSKAMCDASDNFAWVKGSKSRKGYCRKLSKKTKKSGSKCNKKAYPKCLKSKTCSWVKRTKTKKGSRKGYCRKK